MEMNFILQLRRFDELSVGNLNPNAIAIYYHLFMTNNRCGWKEWFSESDLWIEQAVGISRRETILSAINLLKQKGFIDFERGTRKGQPTKYKILPLLNSVYDSGKDSGYSSGYDSACDSGKDSGCDSDNPKYKYKQKQNKNAHDIFSESKESEAVKVLLADLEESRKTNKKKMTDKAKQLLLKKLNDLSNGNEKIKIAMLEEAIERGWLTVFPLKGELKPTPSQLEYPIHQGDETFGTGAAL